MYYRLQRDFLGYTEISRVYVNCTVEELRLWDNGGCTLGVGACEL